MTPIKVELQLRKLYDSLSGHIKALETLDQNLSQWGSLLFHLITTKLDTNILCKWKIESHKVVDITVESLMEFSQSRLRILEAIESSKNINLIPTSKSIREQAKGILKPLQKSTSLTTRGKMECYFVIFRTRYTNVHHF